MNKLESIEQEIEKAVDIGIAAFDQTFIGMAFQIGELLDKARAVCEDEAYCKRIELSGKSANLRFSAWLKSETFTESIMPKIRHISGSVSNQTLLNFRHLASNLKGDYPKVKHVPAGGLYKLAAPSNDNVRAHAVARLTEMDHVKIKDVERVIEEVREKVKPPPTKHEIIDSLRKKRDTLMAKNGFHDIDKKSQLAVNKLLKWTYIQEHGVEEVECHLETAIADADKGPLTDTHEKLKRIYMRESKGMSCPPSDREVLESIYSFDEIKKRGGAQCTARLRHLISARRKLQDIVTELTFGNKLSAEERTSLNEIISVPQIIEYNVEACESALRSKIKNMSSNPLKRERTADEIRGVMWRKLERIMFNKVVTDDQRKALNQLCSLETIRELGEDDAVAQIEAFEAALPDRVKSKAFEKPAPQRKNPSTRKEAIRAICDLIYQYDDTGFALNVLNLLKEELEIIEGTDLDLYFHSIEAQLN